ncbi:MAG: hypothetical protein LBS24_07915, partial [Clostridiales Family XIII bacterium]|nr:hypothetical protein [Clostridiales Family XIII bacterium]
MRAKIVFASAIIVLLAALMMFNPWVTPSLDEALPRIAAASDESRLSDGIAYYFAVNRADGSYIIGTNEAGEIRYVHREADDAKDRRAVISDLFWHEGGIWFVRDTGDVGSPQPDRRDIRRIDVLTGDAETVFFRMAVGAGSPARLGSDGETLYLTLRAPDGGSASAYALPYAAASAEEGSADSNAGSSGSVVDDPILTLTANAPAGARILSAVSDGRRLYCALSDGNVSAFSAGGSRAVLTDCIPTGLTTGRVSEDVGVLFFADAASNAVCFDGQGVSNRKELPAEAGVVLAGAPPYGYRSFTVLVSSADGGNALLTYDGTDFGAPVRFVFSPATTLKFSLYAAKTPAGIGVLAAACFLLCFGFCILARTLFLRVILLQCCLVLLVVSVAAGTGYFVERAKSAGERPEEIAFLAALRAEELGAEAEADPNARRLDAPGSGALRAQLAGHTETLLELRNGEFQVAESDDLPTGLPLLDGFGKDVAALAQAAADADGPQAWLGRARDRTALFAAAPIGANGSRILLLSADAAHIEYALARAFYALLGICALPGLGALLLCVCLTAAWMWPLLRVPKQMSEVAANRVWDEKARFSFGEIGNIQKAVQEVCLSLSIREYEMTLAMKNYQRFMPQDLDRMLERANLTEIEYGDVAGGEGDFGLVTTVLKGEKRFGANRRRFLDFVFAAFHSIYTAANGDAVFLSTGFSLTGFGLLFRKGAADGVRMGIRLATEATETPEGVPRPEFLLILHRADYEYGVTGRDARAISFLSSYELGLLAKVSTRLSTLGVKLIVTERYGRNLADTVSTRYIGYVTSSDEQHSIKLYEVLDVCGESAKTQRKQYNEKFQEAIRLYYKNDFYLARNIFSEIFKNCPDDGVAKWYIFACERL